MIPVRVAAGILAACVLASAGAQTPPPKNPDAGEVFYKPVPNKAYPVGQCGEAVWPREARRYEIEGASVVMYKLSPEGKVIAPRVARSSGWALLDNATIALLNTCKYTPEQAVQAEGRELPLQFVWTLEGKRVYPGLVPDSCAASGRFKGFIPFDRRPTDLVTGVKVRFLIDGTGKPNRVKLEGPNFDPAVVQEVQAWVETCRFAFDPKIAGERTDTMYGRVLLH